jgi:hypothetical protein
MDREISCHRPQKIATSLYILLPGWWTKPNGVQHGDILVLGKNKNGELCIIPKKREEASDCTDAL